MLSNNKRIRHLLCPPSSIERNIAIDLTQYLLFLFCLHRDHALEDYFISDTYTHTPVTLAKKIDLLSLSNNRGLASIIILRVIKSYAHLLFA